MKKLLISLFFVLLGACASAQIHWARVFSYNEYLGIKTDSVLEPPHDTLSSSPIATLAIKNNHVYQKLTSGIWSQVDGGGNAVQSLTGSISIQYGAFSSMPTPGTPGRFYAATDSARWFFDNGVAWINLSGTGGGSGGGVSTASGDANGTAVGANLPLTVTGVQGKSITLSAGFLKYNGSAWVFDTNTYLSNALAPGAIFVGNGSSVATGFVITGDFSFSSSGVGTINAHAVTNAKMAQMVQKTVKANILTSTADPQDVPLDSLAAHMTPDSVRIYRKTGTDSVFYCFAPLGGIEACVFQYLDSVGAGGSGPSPSNPSGLIGMTANNGSAPTYERSDATHAIDPAITPTWSGLHIFNTAPRFASFSVNGAIVYVDGSGNVHAIASAGTAHQVLHGGTTPAMSAVDLTSDVTGLLPDANISSASTWNAKQPALSGTGYAKFASTTPSYLTPAQVTADLALATLTTQGLVPAAPRNGMKLGTLGGVLVWQDTTAGGGGSQTFPQVLATGRNFSAKDSMDMGGNSFYVKNGRFKADTIHTNISLKSGPHDSTATTGTSVTATVGASSTLTGYAPILAGGLNTTLDNLGFAGYTLSKPVGATQPSFMDLYKTAIPHKSVNMLWLFNKWAENDVFYQFTQPTIPYSVALFTLQYDSVIKYELTTLGYDTTNDLMIAPEWQLTTRVPQINQDSFWTACKTIAINNHIKFIDTYTPSIAVGIAGKAVSDGVHPNDRQHMEEALQILQFMDSCNLVKAGVQQAAINGTLEAHHLVDRTSDTTHPEDMIATRSPLGTFHYTPQGRFMQLYPVQPSYLQTGNSYINGDYVTPGNFNATGGGARFSGIPTIGGGNTALYLGMFSGLGFMDAFTSAAAETGLSFNIFGGKAVFGKSTLFTGELAKLQVHGGLYSDAWLKNDSVSSISNGTSSKYEIQTDGMHEYWIDHNGNQRQIDNDTILLNIQGSPIRALRYSSHPKLAGAGTVDSTAIPDVNYDDSLARKIVHDSISALIITTSNPTIFSATAAGTPYTNSISITSILGTGIGTSVIAANTLAVGQVVSVHGWAILSTSALSPNLTILFQSSSFSAGQVNAMAPSLTTGLLEINMFGTITATGSSGNIALYGRGTLNGSSFDILNAPTNAINTTIAQTIGVQAQWGTASTSNIITAQPQFTVKVQ